MHQLRTGKQKTTKVTHFESNFGRKLNTPLRNIKKIPHSTNLTWKKFWTTVLTPTASQLETTWITMNGFRAKEVMYWSNEQNTGWCRLPVSLKLKLAREVTKRLKTDLRGLWITLAPGRKVLRTYPTTTNVNEPGGPEVRYRNNDIAKFSVKAERKTPLWKFLQRWPLPYKIIAVEKLAFYSTELKKV